MQKIYNTAVIGGGAAGLFCAGVLSDNIKDIIIIEKNQRLGKKLSQTGNGQGNITNKDICLSRYHGDKALIAAVLKCGGKEELLDFMRQLGAVFTECEKGRIYPASMQAASITDILREKIERSGCEVKLLCEVVGITKDKGGIFTVKYNGGAVLAKTVVLATGGKAGKHFGTDGSAYKLAQSFGHSLTALYPSLVRLKTKPELIKGLKGVKVNAQVKAVVDGAAVYECEGDILFTDSGISGNTVFELSAYVTDRENASVIINFVNGIEREDLLLAFQKKLQSGGAADMLMCGIINRQLSRVILRRAKVDPFGSIGEAAAHLEKIADLCRGFELQITGADGFDSAQVTKGGVKASEIDSKSLMSKLCENLYLIGEILDADGDCGGFNIQWAFCSAKCAADNILKTLDS